MTVNFIKWPSFLFRAAFLCYPFNDRLNVSFGLSGLPMVEHMLHLDISDMRFLSVCVCFSYAAEHGCPAGFNCCLMPEERLLQGVGRVRPECGCPLRRNGSSSVFDDSTWGITSHGRRAGTAAQRCFGCSTRRVSRAHVTLAENATNATAQNPGDSATGDVICQDRRPGPIAMPWQRRLGKLDWRITRLRHGSQHLSGKRHCGSGKSNTAAIRDVGTSSAFKGQLLDLLRVAGLEALGSLPPASG